jgi:hypothetical protein
MPLASPSSCFNWEKQTEICRNGNPIEMDNESDEWSVSCSHLWHWVLFKLTTLTSIGLQELWTNCPSLSSVQECSLWVDLKTNPLRKEPSEGKLYLVHEGKLYSVHEKHVRWIQRTHSHSEYWDSVVFKFVNKPLASFFQYHTQTFKRDYLWQISYNKQIL